MGVLVRDAEPLSRDEIYRLLGCCSGRAASGLRNRGLISVMWRSGLRCNEALSLGLGDVVIRGGEPGGEILVRNGKGGVTATVGIDAEGVELLRPWLERRSRLECPGSWLFCTVRSPVGQRLIDSNVRHLLGRLGREAGILKRVSPHVFRHTMAFDMMCEGFSAAVIRRQMRHKSLLHTIRYLDHLKQGQFLDEVRNRKAVGV